MAKLNGGQIELKRIEGNTQTNYFMMVSNIPMKKFLFKVKVIGFCNTDRFLDMGLVSETRKNSCSTLVNSFGASGNYSYCGYSTSGVTGKTPSTSSNSGFTKGMEVFLKYDGTTLMIYTLDKTVDLKKDLPVGNYYLFFVLYHKEAACTVTKIK